VSLMQFCNDDTDGHDVEKREGVYVSKLAGEVHHERCMNVSLLFVVTAANNAG
jgi:hypothetical protein